jgi:nucleoside-diphosphate-sugar epimerase
VSGRAFVTGGSGFVGRNLIIALRDANASISAIARSERAAETVRSLSAEATIADLSDVDLLAEAMSGCDVVYHAAAKQGDSGTYEEFEFVNVRGTRNVIQAARRSEVPTLVHVSTEAVLAGSARIRNATEGTPKPKSPIGMYARSKSAAEDLVVAANSDLLRTVVIRPRLVWGKGDTVHLARLVSEVQQRRFFWIDGGRYLTSICHVRNLCAALLLAGDRGGGGQVYFVTDGPAIEYRTFVTALLKTQGLVPGNRSIPGWFARPAAEVADRLWRSAGLRSAPPLTILATRLLGEEVTVSDAKARAELGYENVVSFEAGLAELETSERTSLSSRGGLSAP